MNVAVLGLGNLGSAVARLLANNGHCVLAWDPDPAVVNVVNNAGQNPRFLANTPLPSTIKASTELSVLQGVEAVVITTPSAYFEATIDALLPHISPSCTLINMAKGVLSNGHTLFQHLLSHAGARPLAVVSGPSIANEMAADKLTAVVAASNNEQALAACRALFSGPSFVVAFSHDPVATELGGILKNIYAMTLGALATSDQYGQNLFGAILTLAINEMQQLFVAMELSAGSVNSLSGLGDLVTTASSEHSHNRKLGRLLAQGMTLAEIKQEMGVLPEGYNSLQQALLLAAEHHCQLQLCQAIADFVDGKDSLQALIDNIAHLLTQSAS
jgi:glycerol-3-phosphate dehydrogenase (NAD(P)+)